MNRLAIYEIDHHIQQLTQKHLSVDYLNSLLQQSLPERLVSAASFTITQEFGATAGHLWEAVWNRLELPTTEKLYIPTLDQQLQRLCITWAARKYQNPQDALFQTGSTTGAIKAMWQHPEICAAISTTTAKYSEDVSSRPHIHHYPTCWAYVFGCLIYQLLQWNHSLTSYQLRELFEQSSAYTKVRPQPYLSAQLQYPPKLSQPIRLARVA